jgi:hypothetical protein
MQQLVYAMQFKGQAAGDAAQAMKVQSKGASSSITTIVNAGGITGGFDPAAGVEAMFESEVTLTGSNTFKEQGTIRFGDGGHLLRFITIGEGWMGPSPNPALKQGTVTWKVNGGEGQFSGADGIITSNFTVTDIGEVDDYHMGVIYLR